MTAREGGRSIARFFSCNALFYRACEDDASWAVRRVGWRPREGVHLGREAMVSFERYWPGNSTMCGEQEPTMKSIVSRTAS